MTKSTTVTEVAPDHPNTLRLLALYFAELRDRVPSYEPPTIEDLRAEGTRGVTLVVLEDGLAVGCGSLRLLDSGTAEVKRMFVVAAARGRGHARRILSALEERARSLQCKRVVLDTAAPLHEAAAMYEREGYIATERYNDNPVAARWFEKNLG